MNYWELLDGTPMVQIYTQRKPISIDRTLKLTGFAQYFSHTFDFFTQWFCIHFKNINKYFVGTADISDRLETFRKDSLFNYVTYKPLTTQHHLSIHTGKSFVPWQRIDIFTSAVRFDPPHLQFKLIATFPFVVIVFFYSRVIYLKYMRFNSIEFRHMCHKCLPTYHPFYITLIWKKAKIVSATEFHICFSCAICSLPLNTTLLSFRSILWVVLAHDSR